METGGAGEAAREPSGDPGGGARDEDPAGSGARDEGAAGGGAREDSAHAAVVIRVARRSDTPALWRMVMDLAIYERLEHHVSGSAERLAEQLFGGTPRIGCLIAERASGPIGYAIHFETYSTFRTQPMMWLEDLFVRPEHRGGGVGRALLARLAAIAIERGCWRLDWNVLDWNRPSIEFYERMGAKRANADWFQYGLDEAALSALAGVAPGASPGRGSRVASGAKPGQGSGAANR
ncbi:MAG: GNAT family N-acetyltransferase [Candidatus Eisenbacteria bacterium]|nr:GNAT family N-acetyltransferase [Candidatus Eisenbacteria bacterium]